MKKKGFTLVEVLVAMSCSLLVLAMIVSSSFIIGKMNNKCVKDVNVMKSVIYLKDYIRKNPGDNYSAGGGSVFYGDNELDIDAEKITGIEFMPKEDGLLQCTIKYLLSNNEERSLKFTVAQNED